MRHLLFAALVVSGCSYSHVQQRCPRCTIFSRDRAPSRVSDGTRTLFVLLPGILGFGWEWDEALAAIEHGDRTAYQVFDWSPWTSLAGLGHDFAVQTNRLLAQLPPSTTRVYVIGHSAAGMITAFATAELAVPPGVEVLVANIGVPYAGMQTMPLDPPPDQVGSPLAVTMGGVLTRYPTPAPGVTIESWVTPWPGDPVMRQNFGHQPADPCVGPPGPRHYLPPGSDHNRILAAVVKELLGRTEGRK